MVYALIIIACAQVLHLILWKLANKTPSPELLEFLYVDELLVDIRDDLVDYEVSDTPAPFLIQCHPTNDF
jgi:hypothetical protein